MHPVMGPNLGFMVDAEPDGQPSPLANRDVPDEDGVSIDELYVGGSPAVNIVTVRADPLGAPGFLDAWVDFNADFIWNAGESIATAVPIAPGATVVLNPVVPLGAVLGPTFARFRISTYAFGLPPTGPAPDGEVEDYRLLICPPIDDPPICCRHTMLVLDTSGSMSGPSYAQVQLGASAFVAGLPVPPPGVLSTLGLETFNSAAPILVAPGLIAVAKPAVLAAIPPAAAPNTLTNLSLAITTAAAALPAPPAGGCENVMVIFTDGAPTTPPNRNIPAAKAAANAAAAAAKGPPGNVRIIVIGVGVISGDIPFLTGIASPGDFHNATTPAKLQQLAKDLPWFLCGESPPPPCTWPGGGSGVAGQMPDLGDAPDSSNHFGTSMTAYTAPLTVTAAFPSVFDTTTGLPPGPNHLSPDTDVWLGYDVSREADADLPPDEDLETNIEPLLDLPNQDLHDDGPVFPFALPACDETGVEFVVTVAAGPSTRYVNLWVDYNQDGDWEDLVQCNRPGHGIVSVPEWSVQDQVLYLPPGTHTVLSAPFVAAGTGSPGATTWVRLSVAEAVAPRNQSTGRADGRGPDTGYQYGETEDYLLYDRTGSGNYHADSEE
jgi:uncharacterized protein YegL